MSLEKHDLIREFPESKEAIHHLKTTNNHFAKLTTKNFNQIFSDLLVNQFINAGNFQHCLDTAFLKFGKNTLLKYLF